VVVSYDDIAAKNYSLSAGQHFEVKIEYVDISVKEFNSKLEAFTTTLDSLFNTSKDIEEEIQEKLSGLRFND
jgi:type I restriction enzyme M protein